MKSMKLNCPNDHGEMKLLTKQKKTSFRGIDVTYPVECFVCPECNLEVGTLEQAAATQRSIADAYREKVGLLKSSEIVKGRNSQHLTQEALAKRMQVGIASIKRWEGSIIQSKSMDKMLRQALLGEFCGDSLTGNRTFSIPRVKLALRYLEGELPTKKIIRKNDRMLYAAKYAWYMDMVSFRESGQSITGATYAKLPQGPQLDNYKELVDEIIKADESQAEPLTEEEKRIIRKVAMAFPRETKVYKASHAEIIWKEKHTGAKIPYTDASRLTEI
jgi:putative zinc finger/helix-turn-helix YgiT family protein